MLKVVREMLNKLPKVITKPISPISGVIAGVISFFLILSLVGFISSVRPPKILSEINPSSIGLEYENVFFETSDGVIIKGWFLPAEEEGIDSVVVALHGYPADKGNILPAVSHLQEDHNLLLFDFRFLGESGGRYSTLGVREVRDLRAAMEFLIDRGFEDIGLWGFSLGGAVALQEAGKHSEVKAVVSDSSFARIDLMAPELYRLPLVDRPLGRLSVFWAKLFLGVDAKKHTPEKGAREIDVAVLITHSKDDNVIPFSHALILQRALDNNDLAEFWFREGQLHGTITDEYKERVKMFFAENL